MSPRKAAVLRGSGGRSLREHLIATAGRMIAERGTAGLTVREIAREAGVADGVLYNHFADKEDLLASALRVHVRAIERGLPGLPEPGSGTVAANVHAHLSYGLALHRAILPAFAGLQLQPKVLARFAELVVPGEEWRDRLVGYLHAERDLGRLAPGARVDAAAAMIVAICHETVLTLLMPGGTVPAAQPAAQETEDLVSVVLDGIGVRATASPGCRA